MLTAGPGAYASPGFFVPAKKDRRLAPVDMGQD